MESSRTAHFEYWEGAGKQWYWHLVGKNGEIQFTSEGYDSEGNAERGIHDAIDAVHEATDLAIHADKVVNTTASVPTNEDTSHESNR